MKIVVIGAGLSGLTAALRLQQAGHIVEVVEAEDQPGGRCKVIEREDFLIDTCAELAATSYRRWLALIDELGISYQLVKCPSTISMLQGGRLIDIDMGRLSSVALTPALSWSAKLQFLRGVLRLRQQIRAVPHYLLDNIELDDPDSSAQDLSLRVFGREVTENLIEPLLRPIGGVTLDLMSTFLVPYTLSDWTQMVSLRGGLQTLPKALAARVPVRYCCAATEVRAEGEGEGVHIALRDADGVGDQLTADKCLICIPYDQAEALYPRFAEISGDYRQSMQFMRMFDVKLAYARRPASQAAMVMIPFRENPRINVLSLSHNKVDDRAPPGQALFSLFTEHKAFEAMSAQTDEAVVTELREQVEALYPEVRGHFRFSRVSRQTRVSYVPDAGFFRRTRRLWDAVGEEPRVQLGGDIFMFGGMEAAVASGERAAQRLVKQNR